MAASAHKFLLLLLRIALGLAASVAGGGLKEQKFAMEPQDQTAVVGSRVTLPCRVIGKSGILQWTKDDFGLGTHRNLSGFERYSMVGSDEEGDFSLDVYPVMLEDDARYQCQVSPGPLGQPGIRSHFATVTVLVPPDPPKIVQGDYLVTTEDREIELECISQGGKPAAEITWIDGRGNVLTQGIDNIVEELADGRRFTAKSILKLTPRKEHHNTSFTCQAQNTAERTHRSAKLKLEVKYAPKVTVSVLSGSMQNGRIIEGSEVRLGCKADANPSDVTYKWYLNDEPMIGDYTTEMIIHNATRKYHDAIIKCEVHNVVGKSEESETLDISYGPQFRTKPRSIQGDLGSKVTLMCDVDGNPVPEISWYDERHRRVQTGQNLTVRVDRESAGKYYCKAHVPGFTDIGSEAYIYLRGPPSIVSHRTQFGIEGDNVRVECTAFSVPVPDRIVWTFNGHEVDLHDQDYSILEDPLPEGIKSTLIIRESQQRHFGVYNCSVTNPYGSDVVEINLMQQKNVPLSLIITGGAGAVIFIIIIISIVVLCQRNSNNKKQPPPENDTNTIEKQCKESDRSSNISDLKLDLRTGSSNSNVHCGDMDYMAGAAESETGSESVITRIGVPLAGPVNVSAQEIYRYSADYTEPSFPPKDGQNNNGYVPYVDYTRDYNPPMMMMQQQQQQIQQQQLQDANNLGQSIARLQNPMSMSTSGTLPATSTTSLMMPGVATLPMSELTPNGGGIVDPRFSAAYGNPYLRATPGSGIPTTTATTTTTTPNTANPAATPAPPPYTRAGIVGGTVIDGRNGISNSSGVGGAVLMPNGGVPNSVLMTRLPHSPTSQYIVPNSANMVATMKRGTMATHV